ncbi:MAG TPA: M20/M25/M40 family metallo-hydrolase [Streptosporangiaceae bacterium]|nr:M20/M25/M40 family metallo-hydrolase [Streptosporangiaceae bacterium]
MDVRGYVDANAAEFFTALKDWLAIPSISADPAHHADVARSADWLAGYLRQAGFPIVEIWPAGEPGAPGLPAVYAEWPASAPAPAVLVYGHHDVQPVEPLDQWDTDPFTPVEHGRQLIGRGASDDKGQVLFHVLGVRACLAASTGGPRQAPPVTLKLLIEGEEESGSANFAGLLRHHRDRLACDVIVVTDTTMWAEDVPSMCTGMRGMIDAQIDFCGPDSDLHSGSFGGAVPNPLHAMAALLAGLHDEHGRVTLPRFYDNVVPLSAEERDLFARLPFEDKDWLAAAGHSGAAAGEAGYSTLERIWARPTAEINGMWGGHTGPGPKTIIPRAAHAKVSLRLVAHQEPAAVGAALREYVDANTPPGIEAQITFSGPGVWPCRSDIRSPAVRAARDAMQRAFGQEVVFTREGGSGPEAGLAGILGAPLVFLAVGLNTDRIHAPNEKVEMPLLLKGAESAAYLWDELAVIGKAGLAGGRGGDQGGGRTGDRAGGRYGRQ